MKNPTATITRLGALTITSAASAMIARADTSAAIHAVGIALWAVSTAWLAVEVVRAALALRSAA